MIATWLKESRHIVIFTGAGMSTESGVPDFRSKRGLWHGKDPQSLASTNAMKHNQKEFVDFYRMRIEALQNVKPHNGYNILTTWAKWLQLKSIITQNTDGLHEQAGNINVIPLHGTIRQLHCHSCGVVYSTERYFHGHLYCNCGGFIRPPVVLFGESLDSNLLTLAEKEAQQSDLFIVLGSSLVVSPANSFPIIAKEHGTKLVIVNQDQTPLDSIADAVINNRKIGDVLRDISEEFII
ncbi:NAD-dependent deacylase [Brevibacillus choshinensis]|uniref:NAD-dependent protein deacetylase n=1 Tax=Brevibacillus choshinensis TaxID=54911 RepID=A0ABX7FJY7_BRECH|nr:NAD-dependent deacylase [Brevibacillus choshinensis]QRG65997.1 NAD-dependent deacylase [Brevibacillus choshinensis]